MSNFGMRPDFDASKRIVKQENIAFDGCDYLVSTVDLGFDHSFGAGLPLYYETMIFPNGKWSEMYCRRYESREIALSSHEWLVADINNGNYEIIDGYFEIKPDKRLLERGYEDEQHSI